MTRASVPLPSLPLWLAVSIAMLAEGTVLAGLAVWSSPRMIQTPSAPIEVSLVAVPMLAESAAAGMAGGLSSVAEPEPEPEPEPAPLSPPESEPVVPEPPPPDPPDPEPRDLAPPDPEPAVAIARPTPPPQAEPKPKPKPKFKAKPKQVAKTRSKPAMAQPDRSRARADQATAGNLGAPGKGRAAGTATGQERAASSGPISPAAYLNNPAPGYPDTARRARQEGTVSLRVLVTAGGRASEVHLAGSSGVSSLDQAAIRAVRRWRFTPARQNGQAISAWVRVPIRFKLNE